MSCKNRTIAKYCKIVKNLALGRRNAIMVRQINDENVYEKKKFGKGCEGRGCDLKDALDRGSGF